MLGLPSLHTLDHAQGARIWFAAEPADMRCGFDRLAERVRAVIGQDPLSGHLFLFRSRQGEIATATGNNKNPDMAFEERSSPEQCPPGIHGFNRKRKNKNNCHEYDKTKTVEVRNGSGDYKMN